MTKKTKTIIAVVGIGLVAYYVWMRRKQGKSVLPFGKSSSFSGDENFFNLTASGQLGGVGCTSGGVSLKPTRVLSESEASNLVSYQQGHTYTEFIYPSGYKIVLKDMPFRNICINNK